MLKGWKKIDSYCIELLRENYKDAEGLHFHHSIVQCINDRMLYKVINNVVFIVKKSAIMGNYSMIIYNTPIGYNGDYLEFIKNGIGVRNNFIKGIKDPFGVEYVYNCNDTISMIGSKYSRFRNTIKRYKPTYENGNIIDIADIVEKWSEINKSKHQIKLYKTICNNIDKVNITVSYVKTQIVGFSVVEKLNNNYGIILQRLINPLVNGIIEPNLILHYNDCIQYENYNLNMGGCVGIRNVEFAKKKLKPIRTIRVNRIKPINKLTKGQYQAI